MLLAAFVCFAAWHEQWHFAAAARDSRVTVGSGHISLDANGAAASSNFSGTNVTWQSMKRSSRHSSMGVSLDLYMSFKVHSDFNAKHISARDTTQPLYNSLYAYTIVTQMSLGGDFRDMNYPAYGHWHMLLKPVETAVANYDLWQFKIHFNDITLWCPPTERFPQAVKISSLDVYRSGKFTYAPDEIIRIQGKTITGDDFAKMEEEALKSAFPIMLTKVTKKTTSGCALFSRAASWDCKEDFNTIVRQKTYQAYHVPPCACAGFIANGGDAVAYTYSKDVVVVQGKDVITNLPEPKKDLLPIARIASCPNPADVYPDCGDPGQGKIEQLWFDKRIVWVQGAAGKHGGGEDRWQLNHWNVFLVTLFAKMLDAVLMRTRLTTHPHITLPIGLKQADFAMQKAYGKEVNPGYPEDSWVDRRDVFYDSGRLYETLGAKVFKDTEMKTGSQDPSYHNVMIRDTGAGYTWMRIDFEPASFMIIPWWFLIAADPRRPPGYSNQTEYTAIRNWEQTIERSLAEHFTKFNLRKNKSGIETFARAVNPDEIKFAQHLVLARAQSGTGDADNNKMAEIIKGFHPEYAQREYDLMEELRKVSFRLRNLYMEECMPTVAAQLKRTLSDTNKTRDRERSKSPRREAAATARTTA